MKKLFVLIAALAIVAPSVKLFGHFKISRSLAQFMEANDIAQMQKKISGKLPSHLYGTENFVDTVMGDDYFTHALIYGTPEMVTLFLNNGFSASEFNIDKKRGTPLMVAASNGKQPIVQLLLDNGADTSLTNSGKTAADLAANNEIRNLIRNYPKARGQKLSEAWAADYQDKKKLKAEAATPEDEPAQSSQHPLKLIAEYAGVELPAAAPAANVSSSAAAAPGTGAQTTEMEEEFYGVDMDTSE